jgi:hypothetical protein
MRKIVAVVAIMLVPVLAHADQRAAAQCRNGLKPEAALIYDRAFPFVTPSTVIRDVLQDQTRALVRAGAVSMGTARSSAEAAGTCFQALRG